jgi:GNAT superfamily N-acetyltransferase
MVASASALKLVGPAEDVQEGCEQVLRSLPRWFGVESSLIEYAKATHELPTFVALDANKVVAFLSLEQHFAASWEVHCIAVHAAWRGKGVGRALHQHAEHWLLGKGVTLLQVKTLAATHPSLEYGETRRFYECLGYQPVEVFPKLWAPHLPVLQLVKGLAGAGR